MQHSQQLLTRFAGLQLADGRPPVERHLQHQIDDHQPGAQHIRVACVERRAAKQSVPPAHGQTAPVAVRPVLVTVVGRIARSRRGRLRIDRIGAIDFAGVRHAGWLC